MVFTFAWLPAIVCGIAGLGVGAAIRALLAGLRRGVRVPAGPVEVSCALITAAGSGAGWGSPYLGLVLWTGWMTIALGVVDIARHRLPDALTLPAIGVSAAAVTITRLAAPDSGNLVGALVTAAVVTALFWLLAVVIPRGFGRGDVKLTPSLAVLTGYLSVAATVTWVVLAFVMGAAVALGGLVVRRLSLGSAIPFGPFLLIACWLVLLFPGLPQWLVR